MALQKFSMNRGANKIESNNGDACEVVNKQRIPWKDASPALHVALQKRSSLSMKLTWTVKPHLVGSPLSNIGWKRSLETACSAVT